MAVSRFGGRGVSVYDPARRLAAFESARSAPPVPPRKEEKPAKNEPLSLSNMFDGNPIKPEQEQQDEGGGSPYGRGLGFLINNPVTQTALKPLELFDYGRRAVTLGAEELSELLGGREFNTKIDPETGERTEFGDQSNWDKLKDPTYGVGKLLGDIVDTPWDGLDKWANRAVGLTGDIALDPLSYLTAGVGTVSGKGARASSLAKLAEAQNAARKAGDQALIRALGDVSDLERLGKRGLGVANAAQAEAMGIGRNGLRISSPLGASRTVNPIPGTERLGRAVNEVVGRARTPARKLPGAKALRKTRNPIGFMGNDMGPALERIITGEGPGSIEGALATVALDDAAREIGEQWAGVASQTLEQTVKRMKDRGLDVEGISDLARRAERGEVNDWVQVGEEMRAIAKDLFDVELPRLSGDAAYVMPHVLNRKFRNDLHEALRRGDPTARAFMKETGLVEQDLLEGSGFLQRRSLRPNPDGTPKQLKIGTTTIDIERGTVEELNEKLANAFSWYEGDIYETNPIIAYQRYISGVKKDVGARGGGRRVAQSGLTGDIAEKSMAPGRFDPFSGREDMFDAEGNVIQRAVPAEGQLQEDRFWEAVPDEAATTERNKELLVTQKEVLDSLQTYSTGERAAIAEQLEELANEIITPIKQARTDASTAARRQELANSRVGAAFVENREQVADLARQADDATAEIDRLAKVRYGIERTAKERTARRQKELLDGLDARRRELISQRDELESTYRQALSNAEQVADQRPSTVRAARKRVNEAVEDARAELDGKRVVTRRNFVAANGDIPTKRQYEGARRILDDAGIDAQTSSQVMTTYQQRAAKVVRKYEKWKAVEDEVLRPYQQRLNQALREQSEFEFSVKQAATPAAPQAAPEPRPLPENLAARAEKAQKLLATPRARKLISDQRKLEDLQRRAASTPGRKGASLRRQARELEQSINERARLAAQLDEARASIRESNAARAELDRLDAPRPLPEPEMSPALKQVAATEQTIEQAKSAADQSYLPRIAQKEMEVTGADAQLGRIAAGADPEYNAIPLDEGVDAINKRALVNDQQERLRMEREQIHAKAVELDDEAGAMISTYREGLQNVEEMRLEHERISEGLSAGGQTAQSPNLRPQELADKGPSKAGLGRVVEGTSTPAMEQPLYSVVQDVRSLVRANPLGDDELLTRAEASLFPLERRLSKLTTEADIPAAGTQRILDAAKKGELAPVMRAKLRDNWTELWDGGDVVINDELRTIYKNLARIDTEPHRFFRVLTTYTNFFKTYATLTPGFHIRNGMSATFMNYAYGVPSSTQLEGLRIWRSFVRAESPRDWMIKATKRERDAIAATLASGAGGRYFEAGVADATQLSTRMQERLFANRFTKASQKFGQDGIEGPVRTSMALHSLDNGSDVRNAMQLIDRVHFDYGRVSEFDEKAKRLIPFWTFMSRNLPMQITSMWTKPRTYARYNSFIRNFRGDDVEGTPEYFENIGAFPLGDAKVAGLPLFLQPDFAHTRLDEDIKNIEDLATGQNILRPLTAMNPIFTAPLEYATGKDFFTGRSYDETDIREAGALEKPYQWLAQLMGITEESPGGKVGVPEKFLDAMRSMNPVYDRAVRLAPQATTGGNEADAVTRQLESFARTLGVPIRTLSPQQQESALRSEYYRNRDEQAMRRALAALDG